MKNLKYLFLTVDFGFIIYWTITALHLIPDEYLYTDYENPILVNWNWSFFPVDILISGTGLYSIFLHRQQNPQWQGLALVSLVLTSVSGLQAVSYWTLAKEIDLTWWLPNMFLLVYPLFFIPKLIQKPSGNLYRHPVPK